MTVPWKVRDAPRNLTSTFDVKTGYLNCLQDASVPFEVAISFAQLDRSVAEELARRLRSRGVRTFVYLERPEETLGHALDDRLREVFSLASLVVVVVSKNWGRQKTRLELHAALSGRAASAGVVPALVGIERNRLPHKLRERTSFDLASGTDALVQILLRKSGRAIRGPMFIAALAVAVTATAGGLALAGLGFRDPTRAQDRWLWMLLVLPALLLGLFGLVPKLRSPRRSPTGFLRQTKAEAALEGAMRYAVAAVAIVLIVALAGALEIQSRVQGEHDVRVAVARDLAQAYRDWYGAAAKVDGLATRVSTLQPSDEHAFSALAAEYETAVAALEICRQDLAKLMSDKPALSGAPELSELLAKLDQSQRIGANYFGYQIRQLGEPGTGDLESARAKRTRLLKVLQDYRPLWTQSLLEADDLAARVRATLHQEILAFEQSWRGVVPAEGAEAESQPPRAQ